MTSGTWEFHVNGEWKECAMKVLRCATDESDAVLVSQMLNLSRIPIPPLQYILRLEHRATKAEKRVSEADDFEQRASDAERERSRARQEERQQREAAEQANQSLSTSRSAHTRTQQELTRTQQELAHEKRALAHALANERRTVAKARGESDALASLTAAELIDLQDQASQALLKIQAQLVAQKGAEVEQARAAAEAAAEAEKAKLEQQLSLCKGTAAALRAASQAELEELASQAAAAMDSIQKAVSEKKDQATRCPVCMDRPKMLAFQCGHRVCTTCGDAEAQRPLTQCPECRATIMQRLPLF